LMSEWFSSTDEDACYREDGTDYSIVGGNEYVGCFIDDANKVLTTKFDSWDSNPLTCFEEAVNQGSAYAGLQNGNECYHGNTYDTLGEDADGCTSSKLSDFESGAELRNSVYKMT
jgi:hypothetical protein